MRKTPLLIATFLCCFTFAAFGQTQNIRGKVIDKDTKQPLISALLSVDDNTSDIGGYSDENGLFLLENIPLGRHIINCQVVGYQNYRSEPLIISSTKEIYIEIEMSSGVDMDEIEISDTRLDYNAPLNESAFVSARSFSVEETERMPAGVNDMGRMALSFPGVAQGGDDTENDVIIRGGAPNENVYYLDGIEIPNINHFATQGSSGGPVGLINVNFIRDVDFYSGAFPANRGNTMSSVMDFKQITGNREKLGGSFMVGSSDIGLTLNGPTGKNSSFILSARRSYLQFLFHLHYEDQIT